LWTKLPFTLLMPNSILAVAAGSTLAASAGDLTLPVNFSAASSLRAEPFAFPAVRAGRNEALR
jgi:hypothetical protein